MKTCKRVCVGDHSLCVVGDFAKANRILSLLSLASDTEKTVVFSNFASVSGNKVLPVVTTIVFKMRIYSILTKT